MGKKRVAYRTWNPPANNNPRDDELPPPNHYSKIDTQAILQNTKLRLAEKFCLLAGISWYEVIAAQKHKYCYENVRKWDDSGAKDALFEAHERFYSMINGLPCEHPLPDPDLYVEEVNWNPVIDPGLISDFEKLEKEKNSTNNKISGSGVKNNITVDNPRESHHLEDNVDVKDVAQGCNKCGDLLESKSAMDLRQQNGPDGDEATKGNKRGSGVNKPSDWNKGLDDARESTRYKSDALKNPGGLNCRNSKPSELGNHNNNLKVYSGMRTRACRKREEYQASHRSQKHEDADSESPQFRGNERPRKRYNLRSSKY